MKLVIRIIFLLVLSSRLFSQEQPSGSVSASHLSGRLEFSEHTREYFSHELELPGTQKASGTVTVKPLTTTLKIKTESPENGIWKLTFEFPQPVTVKEQIEGDNLYLEFNQSVDSEDLLTAQEKLGYVIKRFSNGFYTLYLEGSRPLFYRSETHDKTFVLYIVPDYEAPVEETKALKIASARLLFEERQYEAAAEAFEELEEEYPENKDIPILDASLEGLLPRWQYQLAILEDLHEEYPEDDDITKLMWEAWTPHSSYLKAERQIQRTLGLAVLQFYRLYGEAILGIYPEGFLYGGMEYQLARGHISGIVNSQGSPATQGDVIPFLGTRNQGAVYARQEWASGSFLKGTVYAQEQDVGWGLESGMLVPQIQGQTNIVLNWHKPYWAVFETFDFHGREDMLKLQALGVVNRYFSWELEGGPHRVGIHGTPTGFVAMMAASNIFLYILNPNPVIAFNYGIDADYVLSRKVKIGGNGLPYNPVPYVSFENHSLRIYCYYTWRERWYFTLFAGETFNRLPPGLASPTVGFVLKYVKPFPCSWEFELSAYRFPSTTVSGASAEYYTANLTIRF